MSREKGLRRRGKGLRSWQLSHQRGPPLLVPRFHVRTGADEHRDSLVLPLDGRERLHELSQAVARSIDEFAASRPGHDDVGFDPMEYDELHVTFFFAGEHLRELSRESLREWHEAAALFTTPPPNP